MLQEQEDKESIISLSIFKRLSTANLVVASILTIIPVLVVSFIWINDRYDSFQKDSLEIKTVYINHQKELLKRELIRLSTFIDYEIKHNKLKEKNLQTYLFDRLSKVRFGKDGYIFIYDYSGTNLMHPILPKLVGKNLINLKDKNGVYVIKELLKVSKNKDGGFVNYIWHKPSIKKDVQKLGYAIAIDKFKWMIGSGVYLDEINTILDLKQEKLYEKIKEDIEKIVLIISITLLTIMLFINIWNRRLKSSFDEFTNFFKKASVENIHLEEKNVCFLEFKELTHLANDMVSMRERIQNELKEQAYRDPLTKSYNRRYFYDVSNKLLQLAKRDNTNLSIIMIDIDRFKNINDTYGHQIGDKVIILLANKLEELVRNSDIVSRFGGEEFAVIFPQTNLQKVQEISENIRKTIEKEIININNLEIKFTVSIGCSTFNKQKNGTIDNLLDSADKSLYIAKNNGRNQVC